MTMTATELEMLNVLARAGLKRDAPSERDWFAMASLVALMQTRPNERLIYTDTDTVLASAYEMADRIAVIRKRKKPYEPEPVSGEEDSR